MADDMETKIRGLSELTGKEREDMLRRIEALKASGRLIMVPPTGERFPPILLPGQTVMKSKKA